MKQRPLLFKWRHFEPQIIVCAVRWYLRYSLSYRDVRELLEERGIAVDPSTIWRWVQRYAPELVGRAGLLSLIYARRPKAHDQLLSASRSHF